MRLINKIHGCLPILFIMGTGFFFLVVTGCGMPPLVPPHDSGGILSDPGEAGKMPVQMGEKQPGEGEQGDSEPITRAQLHAALMDFADRLASILSTSAIDFESELSSPQARLTAARLRFYPLASAYEIAARPDPGGALLDMVVMVTLSRIVWEEHYLPKVFGDPAEDLLEAFRKLEADVWSIAQRILTQKQQEEFRTLILEWRQKHPEQHSVSFLRFSDFGELQPNSALAKAIRSGAFFPEVADAARAAEEIRLLGERAMYMFSRMQILSNFQVNLAYMEVASQPDVVQSLSNSTRFVDVSERLAVMVEQLPEQVARERSAAINQLAQVASNERNKLMEDLLSEEKGLFHRVLVGRFENRTLARHYQAHLQHALDLGESRVISVSAKD